MKTKSENKTARKLAKACLAQCQKLAGQIKQAKENLVSEFREVFGTQQRLLQLAVNEAEALAWQTEYPHLVFPALAREKVATAANWRRRQELIRQVEPDFALAA